MTHTPNAERLAVELSLSAFTTKVSQGWDLNAQPQRSYTLRHLRGLNNIYYFHYVFYFLNSFYRLINLVLYNYINGTQISE